MAGQRRGLDAGSNRPDAGSKGAGRAPSKDPATGPGRGGQSGPGRKGSGTGPGRGGGSGPGRSGAGGSRPPGGARNAGKAGRGAVKGGGKSAANAASGQSARAMQAAGKMAGGGLSRARSKGQQDEGEDPGAGRKAGAAAARAGSAVATRAAAAAATSGGSLVVELKLMLITAGVIVGLVLVVLVLLAVLGGMAGAETEQPGGELNCSASAMGKRDIPARLMPIYEHAANETGPETTTPLGERGVWILAAINSIESDFGNNMGPSSAGAIGWMQFMPATWAAYGVDADGDGDKDPYDPQDAVHGAARYLRANGAPGNWYRAIWHYNHLDSYVRDVQHLADVYQGTCQLAGGGNVQIGDLNFNDTSGAWGGSMKFAKALAGLGRQFGCVSVSEKRDDQYTASGGTSDHWVGSKTAYAVDIAGPQSECTLTYPNGDADRTAQAIAAALNMPEHAGECLNTVRGRYRLQLIWHTNCGGNHYDHVHIGVRRLAASADDVD